MNQNFDVWAAAGTEPTNARMYYGQIKFDLVAMVFPGEKGSGMKPVLYDPSVHQGKQPFVQITARLNPLAEMQLTRDTYSTWQNYNADWVKVTMPSIRKLGVVNADGSCDIKKFDGSWMKFRFVPGFTKNRDPEKPNYKTMEFLAVYKDKKECQKAYLAENTSSAEKKAEPQPTTNPATESAMKFIRSIAENAMKSGNDVDEAVDKFLAENSAVCAGLTISSQEVQALLKEFDDNPPF